MSGSSNVKSTNIVLFKNLDTDLITCSDNPKRLDSGAKFVYINLNGNPVYIQTPEMSIPYELKQQINEKDPSIVDKVTMNLSFKNKESNKQIELFYNKIEQIDEKVVQCAYNNAMSWFKKPVPDKSDKVASEKLYDFIREKYKLFLRHSKDPETSLPDGKYPSTIQIKIPVKDNKMQVASYLENGNEFDFNSIIDEKKTIKRSSAKCIIQLSGIIITPGSFSIMGKLIQISIKLPSVITGYSFVKDDDEDELSDNEVPVKEASKDMKQKKIEFQKVESSDDEDELEVKNNVIKDEKDDSENDDEDDDKPEPEPEIKKKVVKKIVKK